MKFKRAGFTITELLVVIVVIGILAAITVVSYSGITQKAKDSSLQSDLANASSQLELYKIEYGSYPSVLDANNCPVLPVADTKYCLKLSPGNAISYSYLEPSQSNFITINNGSNVKSKSSDGSIASGYDLSYGLALSLDAGNSTSYPEPKTGLDWINVIDNNDKFTLLNGPTYSNNNGGYFSFDGVDDRAAGSKYPVYGNNMTWLAWANCSQNMPNTLNMFYSLIVLEEISGPFIVSCLI
jgi:prepilin-type N-terminal cleavage/methylation domain-containing protein